MRKLIPFSLILTSLLAFGCQASTLITAENLERLQASHAAVRALDQQFQDDNQVEPNLALEPHCDWQKHYQSFNKDNVTQAQVRQFEELIKQHGFRSGAEYYELSMKVTSQALTAMAAHLQQYDITPDANSAIGKSVLQMQQLNKVISSCLTKADQAALKRHEAKITEILTLMTADDADGDGDDFDNNDYDTQY